MGLLFDGPPADPTAILAYLEPRLCDIAESLSEIAAGIHMLGANQARAMRQEPPAYDAEDFGPDNMIPNVNPVMPISRYHDTLACHKQQERELALREALAPFANREAEFRCGTGRLSEITDSQWDRALEVYTAVNKEHPL